MHPVALAGGDGAGDLAGVGVDRDPRREVAVAEAGAELADDRVIAASLLQLLNLIADKMISEPKHVDEVYNSLPQSARKAIEERDGKPDP